MNSLVFRRNKQFVINEELLPKSAKNLETITSLYIAIYMEFRGAETNPKYNQLNYQQRLQEINIFADNWLKVRGYR